MTGRSGSRIAGAALAMAMLCAPALAVDILIPNDPLARQGNRLQIQNLENRLRRQQFQQQQQNLRELDRDSGQYQPPPAVPRVTPNCRNQVYGSRIVTNCR